MKNKKNPNPTLELVDEIAENYEWKESQASPLSPKISASQAKEKFKSELTKLLDPQQEVERIQRGMDVIFNYLKSNPLEKHCRDDFEKAANRLIDECETFLDNYPELIKKFKTLHNEGPPEQFPLPHANLGLDHTTLKTIYEIGNSLFSQKKYDEALDLFQAFVYLDATSFEGWVALGMCFQQKEEFMHAIYAYTTANFIHPESVMPYLYSCECFLALKNDTQAKGCLELAEYFLHKHQDLKANELLKKLKGFLNYK